MKQWVDITINIIIIALYSQQETQSHLIAQIDVMQYEWDHNPIVSADTAKDQCKHVEHFQMDEWDFDSIAL